MKIRTARTWLLGSLCAALAALPETGPRSGDLVFTFQLTSDRVTTAEGVGGLSEVSVAPREGETYARLSDPGRPDLPYRIVQVLLPSGQVFDGADASAVEVRTIARGFHTTLAEMETVPEAPPVKGAPALAQASASGFPASPARYLGTGTWHGRTIASFAIFPISVRDGNLQLATEIELRLRTASGSVGWRVEQPLRMTGSAARDIDAQTSSLVVNPGVVASYPPLPVRPADHPGGFRPTAAPSLEGSPVDCVIITPASLESSYQRLADQKTSKGVPTVIRTLEWINANYTHGCDVQETIRNFVRDAYAKWGTQFFLLGGDTPEIPARYLYTEYYYGGKYIPADIYYEGLDGTWNDDHDSVFGELATDSPDLYPEVYVTRLPTSTPAEVNVILDKIQSYEKAANTGFTDRLLFLAEVLFPTPWSPGDTVTNDGATIAEYLNNKHLVYTPMQVTRMYERSWVYPGSVPESRVEAIDSLNAGYDHVFHIGHGYRFNLHVGDANVTIPDAASLTNDHQYCNLYMLNCTANAFDYDCLGEHFLSNPNGGAVSAIGASNSAFANVSTYYMDEYVNLVFRKNVTRLGEAHALSRLPRVPVALLADNADLWTHYVYAPLCDPEMRVWNGPVGTFTVSHPDTITVGSGVIALNVSSGGSPYDSATVCLWKGVEDYRTQWTDPSGDVSFSFTCETPGTVSVVVTGPNQARYESSILVVPGSGPYLALQSVTVDDDSLGGTFGNGDGVIDAGEIVDLLPTVVNTGDAASLPPTLTLTTGSPLVSIVDASAAADTVHAGEALAAVDAWRIVVDTTASDESVCEFAVQTADGMGVWNDAFSKLLHAPSLSFTTIRVDDSSPLGNGDGVITSGEQFRLYYGVKNVGTGAAYGLSAQLSDASGGGVNVFEASDTYVELAPLVEAENAAGFRLSEVNSTVENAIALTVVDRFGRTAVDTFELRRPVAPTNLVFDASLGGDRLRVNWDPSTSPDLDRYHVYRSTTPGGPYVRATQDAVLHATYTDVDLAANTRYYYVVSAIDSSGNQSTYSSEASASTNPQQYPGWPNYTADPSVNSPAVGDIDSDGKLEIVVGNNYVYAWHYDGQEVRDGDGEALTYGVFSDQGDGFIGPVALAKLDGEFGLDIIAASWSTYEVYCFNYTGAVLPGWPRPTIDRVRASIVVGDLDGDDSPEIIAIDDDAIMYAWEPDGSEFRDGDSNPATDGVFYRFPDRPWWHYQSPCLADIDNDGSDEVIIGTQDSTLYVLNGDGSAVPGWPRKLSSFAGGGFAVGDIDGNGQLDIICPTKNTGEVMALRADNTVMWTRWFPQNLFFNPSPALADIDDDGKLETFLPSSNGQLFGLTYQGADLPGWPVTYSTYTWTESSPIIGDVNGDGSPDIILGDETQFINAWDVNGNPIDGFPLVMQDAMRGTPALADIDRDGDLEIIASGYDQVMYVWNLDAPYDPADIEWPMFKGNWHRNGVYGYIVPTAVQSEETPVVRASLEQNFPNPFNPTTTIVFYVPDSGDRSASLVVYDVTGARVRTLASGVFEPGRHAVEWDGVNDSGNRVGSGVYFYRLVQKGFADTKKMVLLK